jgi:hypothetical protein
MKNETHAGACWLRRAALVAFCAICMSLASCGGLRLLTPGGSSGQPTPGVTPSACATTICAGYDQNGQTLTLHPNDTLTVTLPLTTWSFQGSSNQQTLAQVGSAVVSPAPFNKSTCPFGGCGTVAAKFRAVAPGTSQVSASRQSCGEAMRCTGADASYRLAVVVTST